MEWTLSPVGVRLWVGLGSFGRLWVVLKLLAGKKGRWACARLGSSSTQAGSIPFAGSSFSRDPCQWARHEHELLNNRCLLRASLVEIAGQTCRRSGGGSLQDGVTQLAQCWEFPLAMADGSP